MDCKRSLLATALLWLSVSVIGQTQQSHLDLQQSLPPTIFQHFAQDQDSLIPHITLRANFVGLMSNKSDEKYRPAELTWEMGDSTFNWKVKVCPRGKSRKRMCDMPPLRVKFSKKKLRKNGLRAYFNKLKLVNFCKSGKRYQSYVMREYLVYKLYNILTDHSFRVQLYQLTYQDSLDRIESKTHYGFFIENSDELAKRMNARELKKFACNRDSVISFNYDLMCMFQYMIGNTDWKLDMLHNVKNLKHRVDGTYIPVPYDFDFSGIVDANYARPNAELDQTDIRQRVYMGDCSKHHELKPVIDHFLAHKEEILQYCENAEYLTKFERKDIIQFIKSFYRIIESPRKFKRNVH